MPDSLQFVVRTPRGVVFADAVAGVRVPVETGQLGVRPRGEPSIAVVESGLIVIRGARTSFLASAGGLLRTARHEASLFTPFAAVGSEAEVLAALEAAQRLPNGELAARRRLAELEQRLLGELRQHALPPPRVGTRHV